MNVTKILYVEDDESLSFVTRDNLEIKGYQVVHCEDGEKAIKIFDEDTFDLCILDVMLPKMNGFQIAEYIRSKDNEIPILFLSAKSLKEDRIKGLKLGADDYIVKPFSIEELLLKIEVFLRRSQIAANVRTIHKIGNFEFDYNNLLLSHKEGQSQQLTQKEADLLQYFLGNIGNVIQRSNILIDLWGKDDYFNGRSLDVFISRLRKYLKNDESIKIENIHGVGFKLIHKN